MIIRKATLGLHHVYMSLYMSLYVKRTTDGGNCLIAWFGAPALGIVHVLFPFPCSDPFQARPTLSSRKGFVMQLTIPAGLALARQGRRMQHPQLQLQISLFSILYYSSGLVSVCSCGCGCKCCIRCNREYPQMCSTRAREVSVGCLPRVSRVGPQHFVHKNALLRLQPMGTRFLSLFTTSHCDYDLPVLTPSDP